MKYTFLMRYHVTDVDGGTDKLIECLGAAGCNDALIGTGVYGSLALQFDREASSAEAAVSSAFADVRRALPNAELVGLQLA